MSGRWVMRIGNFDLSARSATNVATRSARPGDRSAAAASAAARSANRDSVQLLSEPQPASTSSSRQPKRVRAAVQPSTSSDFFQKRGGPSRSCGHLSDPDMAVPTFLDAEAKGYLSEGRAAYRHLGLDSRNLIPTGKDTHLFTWHGSDVNSVLGFAFASAGLDCAVMDVGVTVLDAEPEVVDSIMAQIAASPPNIDSIADFVENRQSAKFDEMAPDTLLRRLGQRAGRRHDTKVMDLSLSPTFENVCRTYYCMTVDAADFSALSAS